MIAAASQTRDQSRAYQHPVPRPVSNDDELGMAWWNSMTRIERLEALLAADTVTPAEAWAHWKLRQSTAHASRETRTGDKS